MSAIREFLRRIKTDGRKRSGSVMVASMGGERIFDAYDLGRDVYIMERGIANRLKERPSVLITERKTLSGKGSGWVMTLSTGNHSVAAFPLLDGRFWRISSLSPKSRSEVLMHGMICANVVEDTIELSQREIATADIVRADAWLRGRAGLSMCDVIMAERNEATLNHYRRLGQEWRIRPLAWGENEISTALAASCKRIGTTISYYHSIRGVHFLAYPEFQRFTRLAETDGEGFKRGLRELVGVYEGNEMSFCRMPKYRRHHEIEFFGIPRGEALKRLVPEIESLTEAISLGRTGRLGVLHKARELLATFASLLARPELADENSADFKRTLYMYVSGEIYDVIGEGSTPEFDDRRKALPGATFVNGKMLPHCSADSRTIKLMETLQRQMSKGEKIEYANVYELRGEDEGDAAKGSTREIVYKTDRRPLENSLVEKRLSRGSRGYSDYVTSRIGALRSLGIALSDWYLMLDHGKQSGKYDYYIRSRCEGEPIMSIPSSYYRKSKAHGETEDAEAVLAMATMIGDAAAQNMAMKKFDREKQTPLFGIGKEIYAFDYDLDYRRVMPVKVSICSIRGSFGWPSTQHTEENFRAIANFYLAHYAHVLKQFQLAHPTVSMGKMAERFMDGFEMRTRKLAWGLGVMRDKFDAFSPSVPPAFGFSRKWKFVMWSLDCQDRSIDDLRRLFLRKVRVVENEDIRNNSEPIRFVQISGQAVG